MVSLWAFPCASGWCCCWSKDHTVYVLGHCYAWLFCDPMDWGLQGSSVFGTSQARILEWLPFRTPGNLPDQRSNPCLLRFLHWQADSLPLHHLEDPKDHTMRRRTTYPCLLYPLLISMSKVSFYQSNRYSYKTQFQFDCFKPWVYFFMFLLDYIDLQCCVSLRYTTKWVTFWYQRKGTSIFSQGLKVSGYICFKKTLSCLVSQLKCFIFISSFRL